MKRIFSILPLLLWLPCLAFGQSDSALVRTILIAHGWSEPDIESGLSSCADWENGKAVVFRAGCMLESDEHAIVSEDLGRLASLRILDINGAFDALPSSMGNLTNLVELYIGGNPGAFQIPAAILGLPKLKVFRLYESPLAGFSGTLAVQSLLEEVVLFDGGLSAFPEWIRKCPRMVHLNLARNRIEAAPEWIGELKALRYFSLENNALEEIPGGFCHLSALDTLYLRENRLTRLPECPDGWKALTELDLSSNVIEALPASLGKSSALLDLRLGNNHLVSLPGTMKDLIALKLLFINDNRFATVPDFIGGLTALGFFNAYSNRITDLPIGLFRMKSLKHLYLGGNLLAALPEGEYRMDPLIVLDLSNNLLESLPRGIAQLSISEEWVSVGGPGCTLGCFVPKYYLSLENNRLCGTVNAEAAAWADRYNPGWRQAQSCGNIGILPQAPDRNVNKISARGTRFSRNSRVYDLGGRRLPSAKP